MERSSSNVANVVIWLPKKTLIAADRHDAWCGAERGESGPRGLKTVNVPNGNGRCVSASGV